MQYKTADDSYAPHIYNLKLACEDNENTEVCWHGFSDLISFSFRSGTFPRYENALNVLRGRLPNAILTEGTSRYVKTFIIAPFRQSE